MRRVEEQELVLFYYGELSPGRRRHVETLLETDAALRSRYRSLCASLDAAEQAAPERSGDYGARVWARLNARLADRPERSGWLETLRGRFGRGNRRWLPGAVFATLFMGAIGLAFLAGRHSTEVTPLGADTGIGPDRVLAHTLVGHLEQSQRLLTTYVNSAPDDLFEVYLERAWIEVLLTSNRLYRSAAEKTGQTRVVAVLDEMERILLGLRHLPADISPEDLAQEQERVRDQGTLFRLRILSRSLEEARSDDFFNQQQRL